jgi:hypothetical protein
MAATPEEAAKQAADAAANPPPAPAPAEAVPPPLPEKPKEISTSTKEVGIIEPPPDIKGTCWKGAPSHADCLGAERYPVCMHCVIPPLQPSLIARRHSCGASARHSSKRLSIAMRMRASYACRCVCHHLQRSRLPNVRIVCLVGDCSKNKKFGFLMPTSPYHTYYRFRIDHGDIPLPNAGDAPRSKVVLSSRSPLPLPLLHLRAVWCGVVWCRAVGHRRSCCRGRFCRRRRLNGSLCILLLFFLFILVFL